MLWGFPFSNIFSAPLLIFGVAGVAGLAALAVDLCLLSSSLRAWNIADLEQGYKVSISFSFCPHVQLQLDILKSRVGTLSET